MRVQDVWTTVGLLLVATRAFAQEPPPPRYEGTAEVAFVGVSGNASSSTFGIAAESISRPDSWMVRNKLSFVRNEASGTLTAEAFLYTPRVEKIVNTRTSVFGEYTYFRDRFAGVANRNAVTGGVAYKLVASDRQTLTVDGGAGYLNEDRLSGDDISDAIYTAGSLYGLKLSATSDISDEIDFVGNAGNGTDWRLTHTIAVTARLTNALLLKVSSGVRYAHFPAPGFKTTDTTTAVALVAKFVQPRR